jgi:protein SCO1/2
LSVIVRWCRATMYLQVLIFTACSLEAPAADARSFRGTLLAEPVPRIDFTLTDTRGQPFSFREQTDGSLTLLFFGYTHCPDVCPVHLTNLAAVLERFPYDVRSRVKVVFVTTDPHRDTPVRIRSWLDGFAPSFIGLHGPLDAVNRIQQELGLPVAGAAQARADGGYDVGHAASILAFTPDGPARVAYPFGTRQADWEHDLPLLLRDR